MWHSVSCPDVPKNLLRKTRTYELATQSQQREEGSFKQLPEVYRTSDPIAARKAVACHRIPKPFRHKVSTI
jgi:hypothetical protein